MKHSIHDKFPFYHPEAVVFLASIIKPDWKILETGCGSSTIWFADRAKKVVSFEHSFIWFNRVYELLREKKNKNVVLWHRTDYPKEGLAKDVYGFKENEFDLVAIDGNLQSRNRSVQTAMPFLKSGGYLLLDDSENKHYIKTVVLLAKWKCRIFSRNFHHETTIWRKP